MEALSRAIEYPESDDEPMTDKDLNRFAMEDTEFVLREHFRRWPDVYVSANLFIYYTEGDAQDRVAPDVFVIKGIGGQPREKILLWEEKIPPQVVFEFVSRTSRVRDRGSKLGLYAALGVKEYYVFDPTGEWMSPQLRSFRLAGDLFQELVSPTGIFSPELGLEMVVVGQELRFRRPGREKFLPTARVQARRAEKERRRAEKEALRADQEAQRAEQEAQRAEQEAQRAEQEAQRADLMAEKLRSLGVDPDSLGQS